MNVTHVKQWTYAYNTVKQHAFSYERVIIIQNNLTLSHTMVCPISNAKKLGWNEV